ncbi:MAG: hypothetical protein GY938_30880 [Ketobacter sp.]|nr:hypothetical protein [Ketobacter sp.]
MARMTLSYADLYTRVSTFLSLTAPGVAPSSTNLTVCQDIVHRGIRQFLYPIDLKYGLPHEWSFLNQPWSFNTVADQWKYTLPIDFSDILTDITFDDNDALPPLEQRSGQQIKKMRSVTGTSGWPMYFALVPTRYDIEIGSAYELWLYPTPSQAYLMSMFYRPDPVKLSATTDLAIGGIPVIEAILETCLAVAETQEEDNASTHHQAEAARLTQMAIRFDAAKVGTDKIGNLYTNKVSGLNTGILIPQDVNLTRDIYADDR